MKFTAEWLADASGGRWVAARGPSATQFTGTDVVAIDTRTLLPGDLYVALLGDRLDGHDFLTAAENAGAKAAVVDQAHADHAEKTTSFSLLVVNDTLAALQSFAHAHRLRVPTTFIAVAGSNGKTTTKEMLASALQQVGRTSRTRGNLNNHIGVPLTLLRVDATDQYAVIEAGMNHPGELAALSRWIQPDHAILTSIAAEHMEGLGSLENVARAEGEVFAAVAPSGLAVFPGDDPLVRQWSLPDRTDLQLRPFGENEGNVVRLLACEVGEVTTATYAVAATQRTVRLPQLGKHNALNAASVIALATGLGLPLDAVFRGLEQTPLVDRRLRIHRTEKLLVLDDVYNANPGSMDAALEVLRALGGAKRKVAVLGDMLELGTSAQAAHQALGQSAARAGVDLLVALGAFAKDLIEAAVAEGLSPEAVAFAPVLPPLLAWLRPRLRPGDVVLVKGSRGMQMERVVAALGVKEAGGAAH